MLNNFCAELKCYTAAAAGGTDGSIGIFTTIARLPRRLASGGAGAVVVPCKFLTFGPNVSGGPSFSLSGGGVCTLHYSWTRRSAKVSQSLGRPLLIVENAY